MFVWLGRLGAGDEPGKLFSVVGGTCVKVMVCLVISTVLSAGGRVGEMVMRGGGTVKSGTRDQSSAGFGLRLGLVLVVEEPVEAEDEVEVVVVDVALAGQHAARA
jgi:hypothetical protein